MNENILLVICLTVLIVVGVNGFMLVLLRRNKTKDVGQIHLFRQAMHRARSPWQPEDDSLKELSERVEALKAGMKPKSPPDADK